MSKIDTFNIEISMPTVDQARKMLAEYSAQAKRKGIVAYKIIHGYGSSGVGGSLRVGLRKTLAICLQNGSIKGFIIGEEWDIFNEATRRVLDQCPELSRDSDLGQHNNGITIVLL